MSGLFRRLSSRRSAGPEGSAPPEAAQPEPADATPAEPGGHESLLKDPATGYVPTGEDRTQLLHEGAAAPPEPATDGEPAPADQVAGDEPVRGPAPAQHVAPFRAPPVYPGPAYVAPGAPEPMPVTDLPAGLDPDELATVPPTSARRSRLRRRAAFLRAARELLLRDLGGFVYELHRTAHDIEHEAHRRLRETKLNRLSRVDAELHDLEMLLDDVRRQVLVREPGVGGECPRCGELFGSSARFCSDCGLPLTESARRELERAPEPGPPVVAPAPAPVVDQPTQEISPLDPDHPSADPEFRWPRREGDAATPGQGWTSAPSDVVGTPQAVENLSHGDPAATETRALSAEEAAPSGDEASAAAADEAPAATAADEEPPGDETPASEEAAAGDEAPAATAAGDEAPAAAGENPPAGEHPPAAPAAEDQGAPAGEPRNGSVFSPVERRP